MDDFERYGDYNEVDEPPSRKSALYIIKIVAIAVCFVIIAILGIRVYTFNHYPASMKRIAFTPTLREYYERTDGNIGALTQNLRAPYDNSDEGNFFCSNLIVIKGAGELQVTLRYNVSLANSLYENYGFKDFNPDNTEQFTFRLWRDGTSDNPDGYEVGTLTFSEWESFAMYRYAKLVFDGIDFVDEGNEKTEWMRLEIFIDGVKAEKPFMIPIYENNESHSLFTEYRLSGKEKP